MNPNDPENLEAAIHRVLRSVPDRRAPASLEGRVVMELSRRAALPWWRQSFAHWPLAVRVAFFVGSAVAAAIVVTGLVSTGLASGANELAGSVTRRLEWLVIVRELAASLDHKVRLVAGAIPTLWLYGVAGTMAAFYGALAAVSAAAYRVLSTARHAR
jgi:hypothetical protein